MGALTMLGGKWRGYLDYTSSTVNLATILLFRIVRIEHENDRRKGKVGADDLCLHYLIFKMTGQIYRRRLGWEIRILQILQVVVRKKVPTLA